MLVHKSHSIKVSTEIICLQVVIELALDKFWYLTNYAVAGITYRNNLLWW
jgi:hypothetical protein